MAIRLPNPPRGWTNPIEIAQWIENLWLFVRGSVSVVTDANSSIGSGATYVGVPALTASRTFSLPPSATMQDGDSVIFQDEGGTAGTYAIVIQKTGSDTINGGSSVSISSNYGRKTIIKRGAGKYYAA